MNDFLVVALFVFVGAVMWGLVGLAVLSAYFEWKDDAPQ